MASDADKAEEEKAESEKNCWCSPIDGGTGFIVL